MAGITDENKKSLKSIMLPVKSYFEAICETIESTFEQETFMQLLYRTGQYGYMRRCRMSPLMAAVVGVIYGLSAEHLRMLMQDFRIAIKVCMVVYLTRFTRYSRKQDCRALIEGMFP